jgi:hypothetical protein
LTFLPCLPGSVFEVPPVTVAADPGDRREEALLGAVHCSGRLMI